MKKKLRLQKEVVSILDKKQMNYLTKGGALTQGHCNTAEAACLPNTKNDECGTIASYACPTQICMSNPCIEPQTEYCGGGETDTCGTVTGCYSDVCPISTFKCEETNGCLISDLDTNC